jgi:glycosyltransferase involved in cell wall biosynthesis
LNGAQGIIGVTPEIVNYELSRLRKPKPTFCHPNGINLEKYHIAPDYREGVPKMLLVASFDAPWHGVDLLIEELTRTKEKFELHLVGSVKFNTDDDKRIIYHSVRDEEYIRDLASKCDLGLSSFALFRKNMTEACPLKVRQYLAMGLCVYSGHIDSGLPAHFPFYHHDELDADKIIEFALNSRSYSREVVE